MVLSQDLMSVVIQVDKLSKQYRLGQIGGRRLVDDVNRWWAKLRGKEDPLSIVGTAKHALQASEIKDNSKSQGQPADPFEIMWALRDVSFEVKRGEVLGIVGKNGAGKSTLLKILSRVTAPSSGEIRVQGRIASLLEVGTGFHPELTGRENIFLNGAILGMTKAEIRSKFDEIVSFAEVEKFIDTPVKRYSSGMYVRLAFAVAAHLQPEILIVDEVLAVGDVEFQKKCLGKLKDVSTNQGRTVLFVSHNMAAVKTLCTSAMLLSKGRVLEMGTAEGVVSNYVNTGASGEYFLGNQVKSGACFTHIWFRGADGLKKDLFDCDEPITLVAEVDNPRSEPLCLDAAFFDNAGNKLWNFTPEAHGMPPITTQGTCRLELQFNVPSVLANELFVHAGLRSLTAGTKDYLDHVADGLRVFIRSKSGYVQSGHGLIRCPVEYKICKE